MPKDRITSEELQEKRNRREENVNAVRKITEARRKATQNDKKFLPGRNTRDDLYADLFTSGAQVGYPHGKVVEYGNLGAFNTFYRGEVRDYGGQCRSTLGRRLAKINPNNANPTKAEVEKFLAQLRIRAFRNMLSELKQVKEWHYGTVFYRIIAQHYGLLTQYLDITDDIEVALFFACCKHVGNNRFKPVTKEDIENNDTKFGKDAILYGKPQSPVQNLDLRKKVKGVLPIGYQPFTRCYRQRGYFVNAHLSSSIQDYDLERSHNFNKRYFLRTPELAEDIYNKFDKGKELFPYDALTELEDIIRQIREADEFSESEFNDVYQNWHNDKSKSWWKEKLKLRGIEIPGCAYDLNEEVKSEIDKKWDIRKFVKEEDLAIGGRVIRYPTD